MLALASASASDDYRPPRRQQPIRPWQEEVDERNAIDFGFAAPAAFTAATDFVQPNYDRIVFSAASSSKGAVTAEWRRNALLAHVVAVPGDEAREGILLRLKAIHEAAIEEGADIIQASENQLRRCLLEHLRPTVRPAITLSGSGYLTATWRDANGQQVGMQFRGDGWIHYFVFARSPEGALRSYVGRLDLREFLPLLKLVGVTNLIYR